MAKTFDGPERRQLDPEPWHLKKEINVSLILVLVGQLALGVWYVSDFNAWRRETDRTMARHETTIMDVAAKNESLSRELADRLARIETKIDNLVNSRR